MEGKIDFYEKQLSFLRACESEANLESRFGRLCFEYFEAAKEEEKKRSCIIKESLFTYMRACQEYYKKANRESCLQFGNESIALEQLTKGEEAELIDEIFAVD